MDAVHLFTSSDAPAPVTATLRWELRHVDGRRITRGAKRVRLRPGSSVRQQTLRLRSWLARHGRENVYLRLRLEAAGHCVSEDTVFLTAPRFVALPRPVTRVGVRLKTPREAVLRFTSPGFQHRFAFELPGLAHTASDNFLELYPGESREVTLAFPRPVTVARLRAALRWRSLADLAAEA
jgi:beta-mannosidase